MVKDIGVNLPARYSRHTPSGFLYFAGSRYWIASLLPVFVGLALPFWLHPPGFSFKWLNATGFLLATFLFQSGFSFLLSFFRNLTTTGWSKSRLFRAASLSITLSSAIGLIVNTTLSFHQGVPRGIFILFGLVTLFVGVLYVVPPFNFSRRPGREVVLAEGLGMLPVLGAYLVQVGDITRTVYLASLPIVIATGLWVWIEELISCQEDQNTGRGTMVLLFGLDLSRRYGVLGIIILFTLSLLLAVVSGALPPLSLLTLLSLGLVWKIVTVSWTSTRYPDRILVLRKPVLRLHLVTCSIIAISCLLTQYF
jgi:1,4-dihydroxy-2-naphthoate octaprenyltransferase